MSPLSRTQAFLGSPAYSAATQRRSLFLLIIYPADGQVNSIIYMVHLPIARWLLAAARLGYQHSIHHPAKAQKLILPASSAV